MKVREKQGCRLRNVLKKKKPNPFFKDIRLVPFHSENDRAVLTQTQLSPRRWTATLLVAFRCFADILGISSTRLRRVTATPQEGASSLEAPRSAFSVSGNGETASPHKIAAEGKLSRVCEYRSKYLDTIVSLSFKLQGYQTTPPGVQLSWRQASNVHFEAPP